MKTIEKITILIIFVLCTLLAYSQNTFEIVLDELGQSEIRASIETSDNNFILAVYPLNTSAKNDYMVKLSSQGKIIGSFEHNVDNGFVKFFGLFKHPANDDIFVAPALIYDGQTATEVAIISFDKDLQLVDDKRSNFSDMVQDLAPFAIPSAIIYDNEIAITAHVVLETGGYGHLYTRINLGGERLAAQIDASYNKPFSFTTSISFINRDEKRFAVLNMNTDDAGFKSIYIDAMDSTMFVDNSVKIEYVNNDTTQHISFIPQDTPVMKLLNDTTLIADLAVRKFTMWGNMYHGNCLLQMNQYLDIRKMTFYFYDNPDIAVKLPLRNSFDIKDDHIISCAITNLHSYHPSYKTRCVVIKYDSAMNVIWERFVNQEEGYYYPIWVTATEDGGCLLSGYSCDESYLNKYSYVLKTDADGYLDVNENSIVDVEPFCCYPNPAKDNLYIEFSPDVDCKSVELYDINGRLVVETFQEASQQITINISGLNAGMYIVKLRMSDGKEFTERIVKE